MVRVRDRDRDRGRGRGQESKVRIRVQESKVRAIPRTGVKGHDQGQDQGSGVKGYGHTQGRSARSGSG